ncbi:MAG TPA: DUF72 domain-containing protein [Candidatus Baltobacteraceae bacterium]|nr:DUF72 domain-containing protein [Candidatus Baltobacteraceae bacterium]
MRVAIGTCGFSYADWVGPVYPSGTKPAAMLELYARRFPIVEIDSTYYRVPGVATFASMARRTPPEFRFTAKLPGSATHVPAEAAGRVHPDVEAFRAAVAPLVEAGKFAAALMQFPTSFRPNDATRDHLAVLRRALPDLPLVAEFRHREWQTAATLKLLEELGVGLVNVDEPHFHALPRPSSDVTSEIAYVRFHGRNYAQWWKGDNTTRYDYLYPAEELEPWADRLVDVATSPRVREVLAFFNNHRRGQAVRNAEMFEAMVETRFPPGTVAHVAEAAAETALPDAPMLPFGESAGA